MTVGPEQLSALADTIAYLVEKGARDIGMAAACGQPGWRVERLAEIERQFESITRLMGQHYARTGSVPLRLYRKDGPARKPAAATDLRCGGASGTSIVVDPNGQVFGCVMLAGARAAEESLRAGAGARRTPAGVAPPPALELPSDSPLWAFRLGDVRDAGFARRLERYPSAIRRSGIFDLRRADRSGYARCDRCRCIGECAVCPAVRVFGPDAGEQGRIPDFVCGFTRVSLAHRERFPVQPTAEERVRGRAPLPSLVRELHEYAARHRGKPA